jgi:large subunit ribosomal protein L32
VTGFVARGDNLSKPISSRETTVAVPKKKKSKMKTRSHRAGAWKLGAPARSVCPRCGSAKLPHTVCASCGWYKDRVAVDVG